MTKEEIAKEIRDLKRKQRKLRFEAAERDMDDAIIAASVAGLLSVSVNFNWLDMEVC